MAAANVSLIYISEDDEDDYGFDFGFMACVNKQNKKRKKKKVKKSQDKGLSFWQKKALAFQKYGEATTRPQDKYRTFLLHRRNLNKGTYDDKWSHNPSYDKIINSLYSHRASLPRDIYTNELIVVNEENTFMKMMGHLNSVTELSLDLEANDDHSYLGMTVLIQIGTLDFDFLIDCFPVTNFIMQDLKQILEDSKIYKYVFGSDNDILWLQRDYFIFLVSALDVQILLQNILRCGKFDEITERIPFDTRKLWYQKYVGPRKNSTAKHQLLEWEMKTGAQPMKYEALVELFYPTFTVNKDAQLADFRPREGNSNEYDQLLNYARHDVHVLFQIVNDLKFEVSDSTQTLFVNTFEETKRKLRQVYKRKVFSSVDDFLTTNQAKINPNCRDLAQVLHMWRNQHAMIIDENPVSMLTDERILYLLNNPPVSEEDLSSNVMQRFGNSKRLPESIQTWKSCLFNLITIGISYYEKINNIRCHNCREIGHAGWGCSKEWNTQSTKQNLRDDDEARHRQVHRRNVNKRRNKQKKRDMEKDGGTN